jgi:hypothetical protein
MIGWARCKTESITFTTLTRVSLLDDRDEGNGKIKRGKVVPVFN